MKKTVMALILALVLAAGSTVAGAATIDLAEYKSIGGNENISLFDTGTGLGTLKLTVTGTGSHFAGLFVDHEIDEAINTFFNEHGAVTVASPPGTLSWEIDEPGYLFGDIYDNFLNATLDNSNGVPSGSPDDVSMALGWNFDLAAGETANINFLLSTIAPTGGFYLTQFDPASGDSIYFSSNMNITGGPVVPEPSTILLLGAGLAGLGLYGRKRIRG